MIRVRGLSLFSATALLGLPLVTHAQGLPLFSSGWSLVPEACRSCPCGFSGVMGVAQNLINAGISLGVLFAVVIMAWAGFILVTSPFNAEAKGTARKMLINAAIGFLIVCSAWLIVDFVMKALYSGPDGQQGKFGPWNSILTGGDICVTSVETRALFSGPIKGGSINVLPGTNVQTLPNGAGSGACLVRTSGGCDYRNFVSAFGSEAVARQASQICYVESKGAVASISNTDIMKNDPKKRAFSFGLFQINLTQHEVAGLSCPKAFEGKNYTALVKDEVLYEKCVVAAKTASINIATAVKIYKDAKGWDPWRNSAKKCGLSYGAQGKNVFASRSLVSAVSLLP
jgi:hypothetical protein